MVILVLINRFLSISKWFGQHIYFRYRRTNAKLTCLPLLKLEYEGLEETLLFRSVQNRCRMYFVLTEVKPVHIVSEMWNVAVKDTDLLPTAWECLHRIWKAPVCLHRCRQNTLRTAHVPSRDITPPNGVATHYVASNSKGKHTVRAFKFGRKRWTKPAARVSEMRNVYNFAHKLHKLILIQKIRRIHSCRKTCREEVIFQT